MPFRRFILFDALAITTWAVGVSLLGYSLNSQIHTVDSILSKLGWGLLALVVLVVGGRIAWKRRDRIGKWFRSKRKSSPGRRR